MSAAHPAQPFRFTSGVRWAIDGGLVPQHPECTADQCCMTVNDCCILSTLTLRVSQFGSLRCRTPGFRCILRITCAAIMLRCQRYVGKMHGSVSDSANGVPDWQGRARVGE